MEAGYKKKKVCVVFVLYRPVFLFYMEKNEKMEMTTLGENVKRMFHQNKLKVGERVCQPLVYNWVDHSIIPVTSQ